MNRTLTIGISALLCTTLYGQAQGGQSATPAGALPPATKSSPFKDWIAPVSNPTIFEGPAHSSEIRPIYIHQTLQEKVQANGLPGRPKLKLGGDLSVIACQLRWQINEELSLIATKDGWVRTDFNNTLENDDGFANLAAGLKWSPIIDEANAFMFSLGLRVELETGSDSVLQDNGGLVLNPFISVGKGFGDLTMQWYEGVRAPVLDYGSFTTWNDMSLHFDYKIGDFYPLVEFHWHHVLHSGDGGGQDLALKGGAELPASVVNPNLEGVDLMNFGAADGRVRRSPARGG